MVECRLWLFLHCRQNHCTSDIQAVGSAGESPLSRRSLASSRSLISLISFINFVGSCSLAAISQSCLHLSLSCCIRASLAGENAYITPHHVFSVRCQTDSTASVAESRHRKVACWEKGKGSAERTFDELLGWVGLTSAAWVLGELDAKTLLGVGKSFHRGLGHGEFPAARGASSDDWNHAQPFQHPEIAC
jgi:hypothetical protein